MQKFIIAFIVFSSARPPPDFDFRALKNGTMMRIGVVIAAFAFNQFASCKPLNLAEEHKCRALGLSSADLHDLYERRESAATLTSDEDWGGSWTPNNFMRDASWFKVATSSNGKNITAIISDGGSALYISRDYGYTWEQSTTVPSFPEGGNTYYQAVASSGDGQYLGLAVTGGPVYLSTDYGFTWKNCSHLPSTTTTHWYDIAISASGQYMGAVIMGGKTWISQDYGSTWEKAEFPDNAVDDHIHSTVDADFFSLAISANGENMVVVSGVSGANSGYIYYLDTEQGYPFFDIANTPATVKFQSQQWVGVALDETGTNVVVANSLVRGGLFISTDGGANFEQYTHAPNVTGLADVAMSSDGQVIAALNLGPGPGYIYISQDAGSGWNLSSPGGQWIDIAMNNAGSFMVAPNYGVALYTYEPNCEPGSIHTGFDAEGVDECVPCGKGTYAQFGVAECIPCGEGTYSSATGASEPSACKDCAYPWDTLGTGDSTCQVLWLHMSTIGLLLFIGALLALLVVIFLFGNNNQLVVAIIMAFPALDVLTDLTYLLISRFYNITLFVLCVVFFMHPAPMFCYKLYKYRALPYSLRYIWWLGWASSYTAAQSNALDAAGDGSGNETTVQGDHIPYPTILGRRFTLLLSFEHHDNLYVVVLELVTWIVALVAQALTFLLLPAFLALWFCIGIFLQMTKTIAMGTVWNHWFYVWTGYDYWRDEDGTVDTEDLNYGLLAQFCLETIPHIILQSVNNTLLGTWVSDPIAIFSLVMSIFMAVATIYKYLYHVGLRADPQGMKDIPLDKSVTIKVMFTKIEYTILNARLPPHSRNITIPTQEKLWYKDQRYALLVAEEGRAGPVESANTPSRSQNPSSLQSTSTLTTSLVDPVRSESENNPVYATAVMAPSAPTYVKDTSPSAPPAPSAPSPAAGATFSPIVLSARASPLPCPPELLCPLTKRLMSDPVFCADGYTYERSAIEQHFTSQQELLAQVGLADTGKVTSPITKQPLESTQLFPNRAVLAAIAAYCAGQEGV